MMMGQERPDAPEGYRVDRLAKFCNRLRLRGRMYRAKRFDELVRPPARMAPAQRPGPCSPSVFAADVEVRLTPEWTCTSVAGFLA